MLIKSFMYLCITMFTFILLTFSCSGNTKNNDENVYLAVAKDTNAVLIKKYKLIIVPFKYAGNTNDKSREAGTGVIRNIVFNSIYSLVSLVPSFDVPEKGYLKDMSIEKPEETASGGKADFIVYGDYSLTGGSADIKLKIWSSITKGVITSDYKLPTDEDIFEGVDGIMSYIVKSILKEDKKLAFLNFGNFSMDPEEYELYVNNRLVAKPASSDFSLSLKVLSKTKYWILMQRVSDQANVIDRSISLDAGETTNIGFITNTKLITGFENKKSQEVDLVSYEDQISSVTRNFSSSVSGLKQLYEKGCRRALIVSYAGRSAGMQMNFTGDQGNWTGLDAVSLWVAGNLTRKWFNIKFLDAYNERWLYIVDDTWVGWKDIRIAFDKLKRRRDDQPVNGIVNGVFDFPIKNMAIFDVDASRGGRLGSYEMYFSRIEAYR